MSSPAHETVRLDVLRAAGDGRLARPGHREVEQLAAVEEGRDADGNVHYRVLKGRYQGQGEGIQAAEQPGHPGRQCRKLEGPVLVRPQACAFPLPQFCQFRLEPRILLGCKGEGNKRGDVERGACDDVGEEGCMVIFEPSGVVN